MHDLMVASMAVNVVLAIDAALRHDLPWFWVGVVGSLASAFAAFH